MKEWSKNDRAETYEREIPRIAYAIKRGIKSPPMKIPSSITPEKKNYQGLSKHIETTAAEPAPVLKR